MASRLDLSRLGPGAQAQLRALGVKTAPKRGRYQVSEAWKRTVDDIVFDSAWEASVYHRLKQAVGADKLKLQVNFELQPAFVDIEGRKREDITYCADFVVQLPDGEHVIDAKGHLTDMFRVKEKLFLYRHRRPLVQLKTMTELQDFLRAHGVN